jgi:hypothetical protein
VYWVDAKLKQLEFCDYDGSNRHLLLRGIANVRHSFSLTLFEDWVYWTDWSEKRVLRVEKTHGGNVSSIFRGVLKPMDIHAVHPLRQPEGMGDTPLMTSLSVFHGILRLTPSPVSNIIKEGAL